MIVNTHGSAFIWKGFFWTRVMITNWSLKKYIEQELFHGDFF